MMRTTRNHKRNVDKDKIQASRSRDTHGSRLALERNDRGKKVQASRLSSPPVGLSIWIDTANLVPPGFEFDEAVELCDKLNEDFQRTIYEGDEELFYATEVDKLAHNLDNVYVPFIEKLPDELRNAVTRGEAVRECIFEAFDRASLIWKVHGLMRAIARYAKSWNEGEETDLDQSSRRFLTPDIDIELVIDEKGRIQQKENLLFDVIIGVEATRIRECEVCHRIFWAGRLNQFCCSRACAHVLRNRRYRERYRQGFYQGAKLTPKEQQTGERTLAEKRAKKETC